MSLTVSRRVLAIIHTHENGALTAASAEECQNLCYYGYAAEVVDLATSAGKQRFNDCVSSGELDFCFGFQGVGSQLRRGDSNLWAALRVPFISLHFDNPCFNPSNHNGDNLYVVNLYHFESFLEIHRRYIGGNGISGLLPFEIIVPLDAKPPPFDRRPIKYLYLKSGGHTADYTEYFDSLPKPIRGGVMEILSKAHSDPNLFLCDLVKDLLVFNGYDFQAYRTQFWALLYAIESYLRRERAIDFVNWLKLQPGAVIMGNGWDFIDRTGAKAEFRSAQPLPLAVPLYQETQFICNTNPYGRDVLHERIINGLFYGSCVMSDSNGWWDKNFGDVPALTRFTWDKSLEDQLRPVIEDTQHAAAASVTGYDPVVRTFTGHYNSKRIIQYAEQARNAAS